MLNEILERLIDKSDFQLRPGDYSDEDGTVYCGTCNKPTIKLRTICGTVMATRSMCACEEAEYKRQQDIERSRNKAIEREIIKNEAFRDSDMKEMTFDKDDGSNPELTELCKGYARKFITKDPEFKGKGLLLYGKPGTGKTFFAGCIYNEVINADRTAKTTSFNRIINEYLSAPDKNAYLDDLNRVDLLLIDDLGAERGTDFAQEIVQAVIDARYRARKSLIVTTNMTADDLKDPGEGNKARYMDRLKEMCTHVEVSGPSRRRQYMRENNERSKKTLMEAGS